MTMAGSWRILLLVIVGLEAFAWSVLAAPRYTCSSSKPSQDIDASVPGEIISPGFPGNYPNNQDCTWKLKAPLGSVVRVRITTMNLEQHDSLSLSDGNNAHGGNLIGKYSLCMQGPLSLFSTGMGMVIKFKSNNQETEKGFKIEYKTVRRDKVIKAEKVNNICSFNSKVRGTSGYVGNPGFPGSLSGSISCIWQIIGPGDKRVHFSYKMLGLVPRNPFGDCTFDYVQHLFSSASKKYCGCSLPPVSRGTSGQDGHIQMMSNTGNKVYNQAGFLIYHKSIDPSLCPNKDSCPALNDDRDVGFDRYAYITYEKKEDTTPRPPITPPEIIMIERIGPFRVECSRDQMKVALNHSRFPLLEQETATLLDPKCKAYNEAGAHVFIKTPLDGCGTFHNYSNDGRYLIYYNQVIMKLQKYKPGDVITRDHLAVFDFECRYHRRTVMSVVHFNPARGTVYSEAENFGNFTFMMRMFKSDEYKEAYDKYPVYIRASKKVFIQTEVRANDSELILLVDKCHVTPSKDPNDKEFYELLTQGCPIDETLKYDHKVSSVQRFNFKAFYFMVDKKATVHIHCKVRVCRKADKNSRCVKGCRYSRRRRAITGEVEEEKDFTGSLSIGPLQFQEDQTGRSTGSDSRPKMFIEIVIGVLGFFVVVLVVAVMVVLWKKQKQQPKTLQLMVPDSEN